MKMVMRRLRFVPLLTLLLAAVLASACGGGGDDGTDTNASPPPATQPIATATEAPLPEPGVPLTTVEIVRKLRPSVVQVLTEDAGRDVFGRPVPSRGIGTGVILDVDGHILTNNHVVRVGGRPFGPIAQRITVTLSDGSAEPAEVIGSDPVTDIAVLRIEASGLTPAEIGDVASTAVGARVVAMGFALGLRGDPTVTQGVLSAKGRMIEEEQATIPNALQTDAGINPGNSGGPLVDEFGRVIGINTAIIPTAENIGFAISIDLAYPIAEDLIRFGRVERGFLGVSLADITPSLARSLDLPVEEGVSIQSVDAGSPAEDAGLQLNDIIVGVQDVDVDNTGALLEALRIYKAGEEVTVAFVRNGAEQSVLVVLGVRPD